MYIFKKIGVFAAIWTYVNKSNKEFVATSSRTRFCFVLLVFLRNARPCAIQ